MTIVKWYGHSCFKIEFNNGVSVLTDPFNKKIYNNLIRYNANFDKTDIVTISHNHNDHNYVPFCESLVINEEGRFSIKDISVNGYTSFHDSVNGSDRGKNIIYTISDGTTQAVHMGDIGCMPDEKIMQKIIGCSMLFLPVGGKYTVDAALAKRIADVVNPSCIFPMHYKTEKIDFDIDTADDYLKLYTNEIILHIKNKEFTIDDNTEQKIVIFEI